MTDARKFLENVLVWPESDQAPGWINVHVNAKNTDPKKNDGKPWVVGWPFKTVDDVLNRASWVESTADFFNVWVCMSQQSTCITKDDGKRKAVRKAANATALKAIWIDCDVKPGDAKHYHTLTEAFDALDAFRQKVGLPPASMIVNSGGGLHVYWISETPLSVHEWRSYAEGLKALLLRESVKCDTGLTTDAARILRVPGTLNHKYDPARRVELLHYGSSYNFPTSFAFLTQVSTQRPLGDGQNSSTAAVSTKRGEQQDVIDASFDVPDPAFASLRPDSALQAGIQVTGPMFVDPKPIFAASGCAFLREALRTGGRDYDQPQWNLSVLCTAFMENGNAFAHEISKGHAGYSAADTQALYDRKVADRAERGIGYPSCAAIAGVGGKHCQGCAHFPKGKSPLNIRPVITAAVKRSPAAGGALNLPDKYDIDSKGLLCLIETKEDKDGDTIETWKPLFFNTITRAFAQKDPDVLSLYFQHDKGNFRWAHLKLEDVAGTGYEKRLVRAGLRYTEHKGKVETFFMSFMSKMMDAAEAQQTLGFGWFRQNGDIEGFAYGGLLLKKDGSETPAATADRVLRQRYEPVGEAQKWHQVASYVFRQQRPELEAAIATSFAAPLMELTGTTGGIVASMGEPGCGKSYAMEVAAAVWGDHKETIDTKDSTPKGFINKLGAIGNLPAFWDEVSDKAVQEKFLPVSSMVSTGGEGARMNSNIEQQARGSWCTLININGNRSWRDFVVSRQKDHGAGLRRVLEFWCSSPTASTPGQVTVSESEKARSLLRSNYGAVGMEYVAYLVTNLDQVQQILDRNTKAFEQKLSPTPKESMWLAMCATMMTGAEVATLLPHPVEFNTARLFDFLIKVFLDNRNYTGNAGVSPVDTAEDCFAQYLKAHTNQMIFTEGGGTQAAAGRTAQVKCRRISPNAPTDRGISIRFDYTNMVLRFSKTNFEEWCAQNQAMDRDAAVIIRSLTSIYQMTKERRMLCAGTPFKLPQEWLYTIDLRSQQSMPIQDLREMMQGMVEQIDNSALGTPTGMAA